MNFRPELAAAVMAGEKTVTRRLTSDNPRSPWWKEGCALRTDKPGGYAVCPGRSKPQIGRVHVTDVSLQRLGAITKDEAQREGFPGVDAFADTWVKINGAWDPDLLVWRIAFEVA